MMLVSAVVVGLEYEEGSNTVTEGFGIITVPLWGQGAPLLKLVSLEAVRDKHAAACTACVCVCGCGCVSGPNLPTLHASWCSMKLSTLQKNHCLYIYIYICIYIYVDDRAVKNIIYIIEL